MKNISLIIIAFGLLLSLAQCKKNDDVNPSELGSENITITLDVRGNGTKADVNPSTGMVTYAEGDAIHVASGGKYVGTLSYNSGVFSGPISNAVEGSPLRFYYLGNVTPLETLTEGETTTCSVVISDQTGNLPVISMASSNEDYMSTVTNYTATLTNKCALVKFDVTTLSADYATCVADMNNKVTVNFSENTMTPSKDGRGIIKLAAGNGEKWAILLPQEAIGEGAEESAFSENCSYVGTHGAVPTITENSFLSTGITVTVSTEVNQNSGFTGALNGIFTINGDGDYVFFSQGNLQYNAMQGTHATADGGTAQGTFCFAEHQYDGIGEDNGNVSQTYDGWIDLFCRATSGWDNGCTYYQPWNSEGVADGSTYGDLMTGEYAYSDWGVYNAISNGGNEPNLWRTLTVDEWNYILYSRNTLSGIRWAKATINGLGGVIILSDYWNPLAYTFNLPNTQSSFEANIISIEDWQIIESYGAVFLPAGGCRFQSGVGVWFFGQEGFYWASTLTNKHNGIDFTTNNSPIVSYMSPWGATSVRLVHDAQ